MNGVAAWWERLDRPDRILVQLAAAGIALKILMLVGVAGGPLVGDEKYYLDSGKSLANGLRDLMSFSAPDLRQVDRTMVGSGWFMPGMSVVLTPLYLVLPDVGLPGARIYLGVVSSVAFLATVLRVRRVLGVRAAGVMLVFPGLVPTFHVFGLAAWGDTGAGLAIALLVCAMTEVFRDLRAGQAMTWQQGLVLGWWSIVAVYLRSSVSILVVGLCAIVFVVALVLVARADRLRVVGAFVVSGVVFLGLLAPWSIVASASLDGRVVTTTSLPTVRANTFGDRDVLCFGECDIGSTIWFSPLRYSRETGRAAGVSEMDVAEEMSAYALRDVTARSYARDVGIDAGRYFGQPARFVTLLSDPEGPVDVVLVGEVGTLPLFYGACAGLLVLLGAAARRSVELAFRLLLVKAGAILLLVQPFVHIAGPRYWTTLAPILAIGLALLIDLHRERRDDVPRADGALPRVLFAGHLALTVVAFGAIATIGLLAI